MRLHQPWMYFGTVQIRLVAVVLLCFTACNQNSPKLASASQPAASSAPVASSAQPLSQCDVLVYASLDAEGEHYLYHAIRERGLAFDPVGAFLADLKSVDRKQLANELTQAKRGNGEPLFSCDTRVYSRVMKAISSSESLSEGEKQAALIQAETEWRTAIALQPANPLLHLGLGNALGKQKRWKDASSEAEAAIQIAPQLSEAHASLGAALTVRAHQEGVGLTGSPNPVLLTKATDELGKAVELDSENCFLRSSFAMALITQRDFFRANKELAIAKKQCPHSTYTVWIGANLQADQGNTKTAIAELRAGLQRAPGCPILWRYLNSLLASQGDTHGAKLVEEQARNAPPPKGALCPTLPEE